MRSPQAILDASETVLVVDWPSRDVPDTLARGGFRVLVHGGPDPSDYSEYVLHEEEIVVRHVGSPPDSADLIFSFRPLDELPGILASASVLGVKALWFQSGLTEDRDRDVKGCWIPDDERTRAKTMVEAAGLVFIDKPYIADVVRETQLGQP